MPHSSGGCSSGGGFHGSSGSHSSSSSSNSTRISSRPFEGATSYVYYSPGHEPSLIYTNGQPSSSLRSSIISIILTTAILLTVLIFLGISGFHNPTKVKTNYNTSIVIHDNNGVLSTEEFFSLTDTFNNFLDKTGIAPSLLTVNEDDVPNKSSLEAYSYDEYLKHFSDEKHWLIVYYSSKNTKKDDWALEGMQGNDTDNILRDEITERFNRVMYASLNEEDTYLYEALTLSFDEITPTIMDKSYHLDIGQIVISAFIGGLFVFVIVSQVITINKQKKLQKAVKIPTKEPELKKCIYCEFSYYAGTVDYCPNCGAEVEYPRNTGSPFFWGVTHFS